MQMTREMESERNNKVTAIAIASFHLTEEGRRKEDEERETERERKKE